MVVEADGGSRGNPGPAGYGAVVRDAATGAVLVERAEGIGVATNNVAEYQGLLAGLRAAAELGADEVDVRMDSKLVVEQMSGRWKIKHDTLKPIAAQAKEVAEGFARVRYEWIPRARNSHADRLANEAMDAQSGKAPLAERPAEVPATGWTGATGTPTRFLLVRHGQTELSVERRYSGHGEVPLTELGARQAKAVASRVAALTGVAADTPVISSPLGRARQTAAAVAEATGGSVEVHQGLVETDFGAWERLSFAEAAQRDPKLHARWLADPTVYPPDGESFAEVHDRVRRVRDQLVTRFGDRTVIVVSHVTPIKSLLRMGLDAGPSLLYRLHLDLASLSVVEFYADGNASVRLVNDTSHLA
ncbi:MAG: bifunctional RNase H/acid phosphatase [Actinophytocola sp.]|uniref:bifunctional RNase H/acid phosphatase n=1 Tax=Actinophytocola sp. TaxID=1872138 RepID=UPI00132A6BAF|nr:bifunctional RNase H/acid phosphatase [Actinophytocola sp.]MPZ85639.1 bifunctional RNase H/acid phosphatase [Actinophytocola sp.]